MSATTSSQLCTLLARMSWAQSAAEQKRRTRSVRLHALPPSSWIRPARAVGGTPSMAGGVLPATSTWPGGTVHRAGSDEAVSTGWEVDAAGTKQFGSIHLARGESEYGRPDQRMWPVHHSPALSSREAGRALDHLQEDEIGRAHV